MTVINLFGVPSSGKSTYAAYIFSALKSKGVSVELVTEFAKDMVWEGNEEAFKNYAYVFGQQSFRLSRCKDKVDVIITDSPLPLSIFYNEDAVLGESFNETVMNVFNSYENLNYFLNRTTPYSSVGRFQTEEESDALKQPMIDLLNERGIVFTEHNGDIKGCEEIIEDIMNYLTNDKKMTTCHFCNETNKDRMVVEVGNKIYRICHDCANKLMNDLAKETGSTVIVNKEIINTIDIPITCEYNY